MADIVDAPTRSRMMSRIGPKDTNPELVLRRALHARGFRYRLHRQGLPGRPDLVFPRYRAVIFVHGCFWHRHPGCPKATTPATRTEFWQRKFAGNVERDERNVRYLEADGWRVMIVWECELGRHDIEDVADRVAVWLVAD